jgi:dTDP-4-amino-4,6-dideoxygalactose transaminase
MNVPFLDLKVQYKTIKEEVDLKIQEVIDNTAFVMGKYLQNFEEQFASYQGLSHVVGTNSGTSALAAALMAVRQIHHDRFSAPDIEVITTTNTFIATTEAIVQAGMRPTFVDIDEKTYNMDVDQLESAITEKTRIILPVHLYGQPADMNAIQEIADKHDLIIVEDCAQAHGAKYLDGWSADDGEQATWKCVGGFGSASGFSFYPGKNLGAFGDGGAVGTNDQTIAEFIKMYRDHGSRVKYEHDFIGSTDRLDALQAAILEVKLKHLNGWNEKRRQNAKLYEKYLSDIEEVILPDVPEYAEPVWHLYVIRVSDREELLKSLQEKGVGCGYHYKLPIHLQPAFSFLGYEEGNFPVTEKVMQEIISLPMFAELTEDQIKYSAEKVKDSLVSIPAL